jgi:hypothetical protein
MQADRHEDGIAGFQGGVEQGERVPVGERKDVRPRRADLLGHGARGLP